MTSTESNAEWLNRLSRVEAGDATYKPKDTPLVFERASGSLVYDSEGKRYIDLCSGFGCMIAGHIPDYQRDIFKHLSSDEQPLVIQGMGDVYANVEKVKLLEKLISLLPEYLTKGILSVTGSGAVETALKTAFLYTQKNRILNFSSAYHGLDFGSLKTTDNPHFHKGFEGWTGYGDSAYVTTLEFNAPLETIESELKMHFGKKTQYAAIIVEPIQGRAGVRISNPGWLEGLREITKSYEALLIFDEVFTGLGRLGQMTFAEQVPADLVCFGKALGGGMPISACVGSEAVMAAWPESRGEAIHTGTFFGHGLSCAVAYATLEYIEAQNLTQRAMKLGDFLQSQLKEMISKNGWNFSLRGQGLMQVIDFGIPGMGAKIMDALRATGVIALAAGRDGSCLQITPALTIEKELLVEFIQKLTAILVEQN